jgi:hypothetical protein
MIVTMPEKHTLNACSFDSKDKQPELQMLTPRAKALDEHVFRVVASNTHSAVSAVSLRLRMYTFAQTGACGRHVHYLYLTQAEHLLSIRGHCNQ